MALNDINRGTAPDNGTGDNLRLGAQKINSNFAYLKQLIDSLDLKVQFVNPRPTVGGTGVLYVDFSDHTLQVWNGDSYDSYGGGQVTYQNVVDALGYTPLQASDIITEIDSQLGATEWKSQKTLEQIQDIVAAMFQSGSHTNATVTYDDFTGTINISASGTGGSTLTDEEVQDIVGGFATQGTGVNVTYDDVNNVIVFSLSGESFTTAYKNKLDGIAENANNYIHPTSHSASMIAESPTRRFVSDTEKDAWNAKADNRTRKDVTNTTQYTVVAADFTGEELNFTGVPANSTINVIVNEGVCPNTDPQTGLQIIVHPQSKISFSGTANLVPQPGATLVSDNDGSSVAIVGVKPTSSVNDFGVFGTLESDGTGGGTGEMNVQSDWNETDNTSDAFIKNKPTSLGETYSVFTNTQEGLVPAPNVSGETTYTVAPGFPDEGAVLTEGESITLTSVVTETVGGGIKKVLKSSGWEDEANSSINNITEIPNRSYNDLQDLPQLRTTFAVGTSLNNLLIPFNNDFGLTDLLDYPNHHVSASGTSALTWNLRDNASEMSGRRLTITNKSTQALTLNTESTSDKIWDKGSDSNTATIPVSETWTFLFDGSDWVVIGKY